MQYSTRLLQLFIPIALFFAMLAGTQFLSMLTSIWQTLVLQSLPYITMATALILSFQFNRSRFSYALVFCAFAAFLFSFDKTFNSPEKLSLIALLSLNLFFFSFTKDRSILSVHGVIRAAFIGIQVAVLMYAHQQYGKQIEAFWATELFALPKNINHLFSISDYLLITIVSFTVLHGLLDIFTNNSTHRAFFCCQLYLLITANHYQHDIMIPLMLSATAIIMIVSILIASHDMAYRDELTSLPSRRALNQLMLSLGRKYTIAMVDIDHFKKFNDTHGHDVGDDVLRMVASKIGKVTGGGKAFRYGGEEFTVVFPRKTPDEAEPHLEALRNTIANYMMIVRQKKRDKNDKTDKSASSKRGNSKNKDSSLSVTISIGLAERNADSKTPENVIKAADQALYRAKKSGRNCVKR